jgi:hypothetical protein
VAEQRDRASRTGGDCVDDGGHVLEVALDGELRRVVAGAGASAIHCEGRQVVSQLGTSGSKVV